MFQKYLQVKKTKNLYRETRMNRHNEPFGFSVTFLNSKLEEKSDITMPIEVVADALRVQL